MATERPIYLHQIHYDDASRRKLDPGFIALDNTDGRSDWFEYWPIRRFLTERSLDEGAYYGFFSPKFYEKTGLTAAQAQSFIAEAPQDADLVLFSPYWDYMAFCWNVVEHGELFHPGFTKLSEEFWRGIYPGIDISAAPNTSRNTIYGNFFAARPSFWRRWLAVCERIFETSENTDSMLGAALSTNANYNKAAGYKVFMMERAASIILAHERQWKTFVYNSFAFKPAAPPMSQFAHPAALCDALKIAFHEQGFPEFRNAYFNLLANVKQAMQP